MASLINLEAYRTDKEAVEWCARSYLKNGTAAAAVIMRVAANAVMEAHNVNRMKFSKFQLVRSDGVITLCARGGRRYSRG